MTCSCHQWFVCQDMALKRPLLDCQEYISSATRDSKYEKRCIPNSARSDYGTESGSRNDNCKNNTFDGLSIKGPTCPFRQDTDTTCLSDDSGLGSNERSRNDNENSNDSGHSNAIGNLIDSGHSNASGNSIGSGYSSITLTDKANDQELQRVETDDNGNDILITPDYPNTTKKCPDGGKLSDKCIETCLCGNNDNVVVYKTPNNTNNLVDIEVSSYLGDSTIVTYLGECDQSLSINSSQHSNKKNGDIYEINVDADKRQNNNSLLLNEKGDTEHTTNTIKYKDVSFQVHGSQCLPKCESSTCPSSFGKTTHCSHRKSKSCSLEFTNETELNVNSTKSRKRYKSEGYSEEDTLHRLHEQTLDCDVSSVKCEVVWDATTISTDGCSNIKSNGSGESDPLLQQVEQHDHSVSVVQSWQDQNNASKRLELDPVIKQKIILGENLMGSLSVNLDKEDMSEECYRESPVLVREEACDKQLPEIKKDRSVCCNVCSSHYTEFYNKMDAIIHDYQWLHKQTEDALKSVRRLKAFMTKMTIFALVIVISVVCLSFTLVLVQKLTGSEDWLPEVFNKNITTRVAGLQEQYVDVSDMVNDLLTKTRPIIQLTNEGTPSRHGNSYFLTWTARGSLGQGGLGLSDRNDAIIATAGGYYSICAKLYYNTRIENATSVKLEYDVIQRARGGGPLSVQHAIQVFPATSGPLRYELKSQTTAYIYPGDEIKISVGQDQLPYLADFDKAHELSMFEVS